MPTENAQRLDEFERSILGAIMLDEGVMDIASQELDSDDFTYRKNRLAFEIMLAMFTEGEPIDVLTLAQRAHREEAANEVSSAYVSSLTDVVPTTANVRFYIQEVQRAAYRRKLLGLAKNTQQELSDGVDESQVVDKLESGIVDLSRRGGRHHYQRAASALMSAQRRIDYLVEHGENAWNAQTGWREIDKMLGGLEQEDYMVIGARPSVGKSALALQMAFANARRGKSVAFFTLEMSGTSLMTRSIAQQLMIDGKKLRTGFMEPKDYAKITNFGEELSEMKLFINDTPNMRMSDLRMEARMIKQREGLDVLIVDYLTLIRYSGRLQRWEEVSAISRTLKEIARELGVSVIAMSQLGRDYENKRPTLASLRESGAIEQDADIVLLLHRKREPEFDLAGNVRPQMVEFILAKHRNGPVGTVDMLFKPEYTRFGEMDSRGEAE